MIFDRFDFKYPDATKISDGYMSNTDKMKLDSISTKDLDYIDDGIKYIKETKVPVVIYGMEINTGNSNPDTCVTYTDTCAGYTPLSINVSGVCNYGSWEPFIKNIISVKPCLFKNGTVVSYLNENDYTKTKNGTPADISSGTFGDVMIEFSKVYYKLYKESEKIIFKIANKQIDSTWQAFAYCTNNTGAERDKIYIGAYPAAVINNRLRSLSGANVDFNRPLSVYRKLANGVGSRYEVNTISKYVFIKYLTFLVTKSLNIQSKIGKSNALDPSSTISITGNSNNRGLFSCVGGYPKIFGIEGLYGTYYEYLDGIYHHLDELLIKKYGPYDNLKYYDNRGAVLSISGYVSNEYILDGYVSIASKVTGSTSTYFCTYCDMNKDNSICVVGGKHINATISEMRFIDDTDLSKSITKYGARLTY